MNKLSSVILLTGMMALSACANTGAGRFGLGGGDAAGAGLVGAGAGDPASAAYFSQTVGDRVLFPVDQSSLTAEARQLLAAQAQWLNTNPQYTAVVEGHADEQGTREYNLALGARRAAAAQEFLVAQGVLASRLRTVTFGKERPIEICSQEGCYAKNRRAVTVIAAGAGV
ncbi:MAG: peptidoglycan-associated lipoprotein Pal [Rhodobacteraceae bacterium]|nr:peptidoglycan-associated lipoprotein Pal [Paracoccaceae bacterium]